MLAARRLRPSIIVKKQQEVCMGEKIMITDGCEAEVADYKPQVVIDYHGNPLIEALPPLLPPAEIVEKLAFYPESRREERYLHSHYRIHMVNRLFLYRPLTYLEKTRGLS